MKIDYVDVIKEIADNKIAYIKKHGHAKAGVNGPYRNMDTPVRNSAHWIITYSYLYEVSGDVEYYDVVKVLAEYIMKPENYGCSGSIYCRLDARFDKTNGLIGQAWVIEAMLAAATTLCEKKYYIAAKNLFIAQNFNSNNCMWEIVDCDGSKDFDITFNHQLWFAAAGAGILKYEEENQIEKTEQIDEQICCFLTASHESLFQIEDDGLIIHRAAYQMSPEEKEYRAKLTRKRKIESVIQNPAKVIKKKVSDKLLKVDFGEGLEQGYHLFDLYGFALLKEQYGWHQIYQSDKLLKAISYGLDEKNLLTLRNSCGGEPFNKFAFGYNSPAFEYPYVSMIFTGKMDENIQNVLFQFQMEETFVQHSFSRHCVDPETMDARLYELVRYLRLGGNQSFEKKKNKRICFLTNEIAEIGGRQRVNISIANAMAEEDLDVSIITTSSKKVAYDLSAKVRLIWEERLYTGKKYNLYKIVRYINKNIYNFHNVNFLQHIYFPPREIATYNSFFEENNFDIIIAVGTRPGGMLSLLKTQSKKIVWLHNAYGTYFNRKGIMQWGQEKLYKKLLRKMDAVVVLTDKHVNTYKEKLNVFPRRIYNPLTIECVKTSELDSNVVLFVGRLDYSLKGIDLLLESMCEIIREIPGVTLSMVGEGGDDDKIRLEIERRGLSEHVILQGATSDVVPYYLESSVVVVPSRYEGFGLVVTEAMKCGVPVVSYKTEGPSEIIIDGKNGFLVDNYDTKMFADKVILLLRNGQMRNEIGQKANERAEDFSTRVIINEWKTLFANLEEENSKYDEKE